VILNDCPRRETAMTSQVSRSSSPHPKSHCDASRRGGRGWRRVLSQVGAAMIVTIALAGPAAAQDPCDINPESCEGSTPVTPAPTTLPGTPTTPTVPVTPTTSTVPTTPGVATNVTASVTPASAAPGGALSVSASGFAAGASLSVTIDGSPAPVPTATADTAGTFSLSLTLPGTIAAGSHSVTVTGNNPQGSTHTATGTFSVTLAQTGAGETLAMTAIGLALLAVGFRLVEHVRWTRRVSTATYVRR